MDNKPITRPEPYVTPDNVRAQYIEQLGDPDRPMRLPADNPFEQLAKFWTCYPPRGQKAGEQALNIIRCMLEGSTADRIAILNQLTSSKRDEA